MEKANNIQIYKTKEYVKNYNKDYYNKNKTDLLQKASVKVSCPHCSLEVQKQHLTKHKKTQRCIFLTKNKVKDNELIEKFAIALKEAMKR